MAQRTVLEAFKRLIEPELKARGFSGRKGHFVRTLDHNITQVIELQHSIYGGRMTANLGIDLDVLKPLVRWLPTPSLGPHAHDATRWVRVGLVRPDHADCWWGFDSDSEDGADDCAKGAGRAILDHGIPWLDTESTPEAFLKYAEARLDRSKTADRPHGSFLECRLMAAVLACNKEIRKAELLCEQARLCWPEEQERLSAARADFRKKHPQLGRKVPEVPDIQAELELFISTTTASSLSSVTISVARSPRPRRSKSARLRSSPV